uniref:Uncharacterized protein n=1 Tax=Musa balbisiana TaxID=52838 RepID=Q1EP72_MUSBA|nr:hypothetical protein MBP_81C12.8 [Musa balbisiana]
MSAVSRCPAHATDTNKFVIDKGSPGSSIRRRQAARRRFPSVATLLTLCADVDDLLSSQVSASASSRYGLILVQGVVRKRWSRYGSLEAHPPISPVPFDEHASCSKSINGDSRRSRTTRPTAVDTQPKPKNQERTRRKPYGDEKDRSQTQDGFKKWVLDGFASEGRAVRRKMEEEESEGGERRNEGWKDFSYHLISYFLLRTARDATVKRGGVGVGVGGGGGVLRDAMSLRAQRPWPHRLLYVRACVRWRPGSQQERGGYDDNSHEYTWTVKSELGGGVAVGSPGAPQTWPVRLGVGRRASESGAARDVGFDPRG